MKIVLVPGHAPDHPDIPILTEKLVAASIPALLAERPPGAVSFLPCIAALRDDGVAAQCFGVSAQVSDIQTALAASGAPPAAQPNNPGNPYFGKSKLDAGAFITLAIGALGLTRWTRLQNDPAFSGVKSAIQVANPIDVDDKRGQFIALITYLRTTNGADGAALLTANELTALMAAWK